MYSSKVISISFPEYTVAKKPDYSLGRLVDEIIEQNFNVKNIIIRAISSSDHPQYSIDKLVDIILEEGTDKYDPERKGVAHEEFEPYKADLQAGPYEADNETGSFFGGVMRNFYEKAPIDRGYSLRIDLLLVYDRNQLVQAEKIDKDEPGVDPRFEKFLFRFKDPNNKQKALLGIIKITKT